MEENIKKYIIYSLFPFFSIIFIIYGFFDLEFLQGNNINEYTNDFCQLNCSSIICKNKYKKNKIIWIFVDGNAYDQLVLLSNKTKYKIPIIFRGKGQGYKHTSILFSEMFSGVPSKSLFYSELKTDHIFKQLYKANYTMNFLGINEPVNKMCGKESKTFKNKRVLRGHEECSFCDFCNVTYPIEDSWCQNYYNSIINIDQRLPSEISKQKVYSDLDYHFKKENLDVIDSVNLNECFKKSFFEFTEKESIIYYNTEVDKYNHLLTKEHIKTIGEEYNTENWIIKIMKWIDEHPDYALIVNSDHGGQKFYGEDDINNHGFDIEGNEAILFIYTKDFKDNYDKLKLDNIFYNKVDPSSIISQILENVNIPLQSEGISYPIGNDSLFRYTAYKSKEVQLINQLNTYIKKYSNYKEDLKEIINKIKNSEFYKIKEEEYEKYFDENFSERAINFIKGIQDEVIDTLNNKNKNISSHILLCLIITIIYAFFISYQIKDIFKIVNEDVQEEKNNIKLLVYILIASLFLIQFFNYIFINLSIYNRFVIGIFATPFFLIISNILIKIHYSEENYFKLNSFLFIIGLMSIIFHYSKLFILMKEYFSSIIKSRILKAVCLCPILFFVLNYNIKKNFLHTNLFLFKYQIYNIIKAIYISYVILIFSFDMSTDNYFTAHTPFNYFITLSIYILFIVMLGIGEYIIKNNLENDINGKYHELIKIVFFLFEFFINDESNRLMLLIIFIIYEFLFDEFFNNELKKINKIIISITIINVHEIFYLLVCRVYSLETSKLFFSRTIAYDWDSGGIFNTFIKIFYKIRFPTILAGFYLEMNLFGNKLFNNQETFLIKLILNIRCALNFIFYSYEFIFLKNNVDYITIMVYSAVDLSIFLLDFINNFLIYLNLAIIKFIIRKKTPKAANILEF